MADNSEEMPSIVVVITAILLAAVCASLTKDTSGPPAEYAVQVQVHMYREC